MKNLFEEQNYKIIIDRLDNLSPESKAQWGKMNVSQMLAHCTAAQNVMNGTELKGTPFIVKLFKGMIKKTVLNAKPFKRSLQTHPQYVVSNFSDFNKEKELLIKSINTFYTQKPDILHPIFGKLTEAEKGWVCYKHLDHHFTQFGV